MKWGWNAERVKVFVCVCVFFYVRVCICVCLPPYLNSFLYAGCSSGQLLFKWSVSGASGGRECGDAREADMSGAADCCRWHTGRGSARGDSVTTIFTVTPGLRQAFLAPGAQ